MTTITETHANVKPTSDALEVAGWDRRYFAIVQDKITTNVRELARCLESHGAGREFHTLDSDTWYCYFDHEDREDFATWLHLIGDPNTPVNGSPGSLVAAWDEFIHSCRFGQEVSFPLPPMPDDDLTRMATIYEDTTEPETCTTPHSGRSWDSPRAGSPSGMQTGSLVDDAQSALCNAKSTTFREDYHDARRQESHVHLRDEHDVAQDLRSHPSRSERWMGRDIPEGDRSTARARGVASPGHARRDRQTATRPEPQLTAPTDLEPMGLMVDGMPVAYLDAFDPDEYDTDVNHLRDTTKMIPSDPDETIDDLPVNPDYHSIHPSPLDRADVLALRAFGIA